MTWAGFVDADPRSDGGVELISATGTGGDLADSHRDVMPRTINLTLPPLTVTAGTGRVTSLLVVTVTDSYRPSPAA